MKTERVFSIGVVAALLIGAPVRAEEGRWVERKAAAVEQDRRASYERGVDERSAPRDKGALGNAAGKAHQATSVARGAKAARGTVFTTSSRTSYFDFFDAHSDLLRDRDDDGYHREFRIRFDADTSLGDVSVYARLYLRRLGESEWLLYHTTDDFWIEGDADDDDYFVTTTLEEGYPTGDYDVLIDLYESGYDGVVATIGPNESAALGLLPLEEAGLDAPIEIDGYAMGEVVTTLLIDDDRDEHYSRFRIRFDPDADVDGRIAYARVWVRAQGGEWFEEHVTDDFIVDAHGDADAYTLTADWLEGYPTAFYDVQIDMYDAATNLLAATAGSERAALSRVPLEDAERDARANPPTSGGGGADSRSREGGGGAMSLGLALLLFAFATLRGARLSERRA